MEIDFTNLARYKIEKIFFEKIAHTIQELEKIKGDFSLGVILVGQARMRNINKRYAGKNKVTDVLSFSFSEIKKETKKELKYIGSRSGSQMMGEIFLCPSRIKKQSRRLKRNFLEELTSVFIHGMMHLLGYDHIKNYEAEKMKKREEGFLKILERELL